ncbi:MAG: type III secretion system export apparatus subunit SctV [Pseudomonadota bacterium]
MTGFTARLTQARDLSIGLLLFVVVMLMILPMPTILVDVLIGLSFGVAVLLLMTGIYISTPLSISSLPAIILISTIFRLALSITTTRLILADADAGAIVETFGTVVVAGNIVVGMVVFFIITIVQFIVIAKGSERIAEVGARFTLDALPGKQMAIDAELRNGDIDADEASRRRGLLERESQFYGAMDGAMKFVKGDTIAGLIIIFVNLLGGLTVGVLQRGMPLGEAMAIYSLLTVGDALISQIPALLMSITAAVIVTRVKGKESRNLGADIAGQVFADTRALRLAGAALIVMGLLPGFPTMVLSTLGLIFLAAGFFDVVLTRRRSMDGDDREAPPDNTGPPVETADGLMATDEAQIVVEMAAPLFALSDEAAWAAALTTMADRVAKSSGLQPCTITACSTSMDQPGQYRVLVDGVPVLWSDVDQDKLVLEDVSDILAIHDIPFEMRETAIWTKILIVDVDQQDNLTELGLRFDRPVDAILRETEIALRRNLATLVGLQETRDILSGLETSHPVLVGEVLRVLSVQKVAEVFRRLLSEGVFLTNKRRILETLVEWAPVDQSPLALTEYCRIGLTRQICQGAASLDRSISAIVIQRETEDMLRAGLKDTNIGTYLVLSEMQTAELLNAIRAQVDRLAPKGLRPVIMTSMDLRRHLKVFLTRNAIEIDVLSFQELNDDYKVVPCSTLTLSSARVAARRASRQAAAEPPQDDRSQPPAT